MIPRLVLLGTGTCNLDSKRAGSAVLIELPGSRVVFDFGRGVAARVARMGFVQDDIQNVVLSHFHPDHLSDLVPFIHAGLYSTVDPRTRDLCIFGPVGVHEMVARLLSIVGFPDPIDAPFRVVVREVEDRLSTGDLKGSYTSLPPAGNHGLRFDYRGRSYAVTGDSHFHQEEIEFVRQADLAIIDAGHLSDDELVELAVASAPRILICSHLYRDLDLEWLQGQARTRGFAGRILIGRDGMAFAL